MALKGKAVSTLLIMVAYVGIPPALSRTLPNTNPDENGPYFQGDIILPQSLFSGLIDVNYRWSRNTIVYEYDSNYPAKLRATFEQAASHISQKTCIRFKERSSFYPEPDYIAIISGSSCYSYVGRQGGRQPISLPSACNSVGIFVHEILHVVGFRHEHSRTDRDEHVKILWENVADGKENQFRKFDESTVSSFGVPYDYNSILHYSSRAFSRDPRELDTIIAIPDESQTSLLGQRDGMSRGDVEKVNRMYECDQR